MKMLHALQGQFNMRYLNNVNGKLMPKVLSFVQESAKYSGTEERNLDTYSDCAVDATEGLCSSRQAYEEHYQYTTDKR